MPGTWQPLINQPPFSLGTMLLLTNGSVFCHAAGTRYWWQLKPDSTGSYHRGTWSRSRPMHYEPLSEDARFNNGTRLGRYISAVLPDGRVLVYGHSHGFTDPPSTYFRTALAEIYDPLFDQWYSEYSPPLWGPNGACCVLPDGLLLLAVRIPDPDLSRPTPIVASAIFDPRRHGWRLTS